MYVAVCVYVYVYGCMYIYIYIYTHTQLYTINYSIILHPISYTITLKGDDARPRDELQQDRALRQGGHRQGAPGPRRQDPG